MVRNMSWKVEGTKIYFFQKYKDKPIFYNDHGMIVVDVNEKGEFISYTQTMLTDLKEMSENEKAKEQNYYRSNSFKNLYFKTGIKQNTHFKEQIGYATLVASLLLIYRCLLRHGI